MTMNPTPSPHGISMCALIEPKLAIAPTPLFGRGLSAGDPSTHRLPMAASNANASGTKSRRPTCSMQAVRILLTTAQNNSLSIISDRVGSSRSTASVESPAVCSREILRARSLVLADLKRCLGRIRVRIGKSIIDLKRGQCAFATRFLAAKWLWAHSKVVRYLTGSEVTR